MTDVDSLLDATLYRDGRRVSSPTSVDSLVHDLHEGAGDFAWVDLFQPSREDLTTLGKEFGLHPLAIEDAIDAHQRPKVERYGDSLFVVLRPATIENGTVAIGEQHAFIAKDYVVTVRHSEEPNLATVQERFEERQKAGYTVGAANVLYGLFDAVVDAYFPVLDRLEDLFDALEQTIYAGSAVPSTRIYGLTRQAIDLDHALAPLPSVITSVIDVLSEKNVADADGMRELSRYFRDVADHVRQVQERCSRLRHVLSEVVTVNSTLIAERQNEQMKRISAWAGIFFFPTFVAGVYGMNFAHMPELHWALGYPMSFGIMALGCFVLYLVFKRNDWL